MNFPNYRDFYQKALIPIGSADQTELTSAEFDFQSFSTHWLIALEGELATKPNEYYHWKVKIFPSNSEGTFNWNKPFYTSTEFKSFDTAIEVSRTFESYSKNDQIHTTNLQEKIC
jgi:hypothetical protein